MDKPWRWPLWSGVGVVFLLVVGLAWHYFHRTESVESSPDVRNLTEPVKDMPVMAHPVTLPPESGLHDVRPPETTASLSPEGHDVSAKTNQQSAAVVQIASSSDTGLVSSADALLAAGKKDKAREQYLSALDAKPDERLRARIEETLGSLNVECIRHPWPMAEKQEVIIREGDSVKAIARKSGTTVELVVKGNELKRPDVIRPGQRLKVFTGKMAITVSKTRNDLLLTANDRFFKRYRVGTGRYDKTPVGAFVISERIPEPPWWRDDGRIVPFGDKENILGTRWMAIKATNNTAEIKGYGIHGTWDNASIGKAESAGCIRLKNEDVEELFELVPVGTPVVIEE